MRWLKGFLFLLLMNVSSAEALKAELVEKIVSSLTPVHKMTEAELRELASGNQWYDVSPERFSANYLIFRLADYATAVFKSSIPWNDLDLKQKERFFLKEEKFKILPTLDNELLFFKVDLKKVLSKKEVQKNPWPERLSPEDFIHIEGFLEKSDSEVLRMLKDIAPLELEYSGYYPGMDDEVAPMGVIGDWYVSEHKAVLFEDGQLFAHDVEIKLDGFMRMNEEGGLLLDLPQHYETLEEALAAGATQSDVCWSYRAVMSADFKEFYFLEELPFWCGF